MDEWGLEALELKASMVILVTKIGEMSDTNKLIGELGRFVLVSLESFVSSQNDIKIGSGTSQL